MNIKQTIPRMTEYNFFKLLVATKKHEGYNPIINRHELEQKLYEYHDQEEFKILLEHTDKKENLDGLKYIDLSSSFLNGYAYGMITMIHDGSRELKYMINMSYQKSEDALNKYTEEEKTAMIKLLDKIEEKEKPLVYTKK